MVQPPQAKGWELMYWFTDHVFLRGKWTVLTAIAVAPTRENLPVKLLAPVGGALLMVGSFLQLQDPIFLVLVGLVAGAILKTIEWNEPKLMLAAAGGMVMGMPVNGFTGLLAAKSGYKPELMDAMFGATAGIGSLAVAVSFMALFFLAQRLLARVKRR